MKFSWVVRPICLNKIENEKPVCPDQSLTENLSGGCATVAGWGQRFDFDNMEESKCRTDVSKFSPDKIQ